MKSSVIKEYMKPLMILLQESYQRLRGLRRETWEICWLKALSGIGCWSDGEEKVKSLLGIGATID